MVAAWISADTGVGPAMASGSQVWSGNWPLLPMMPMNRQRGADEQHARGRHRGSSAYALIADDVERCPRRRTVMMMPIIRPMSPVRVVRNALSAASVFALSSHQWPMSMNEQRPTRSQPTSSCSVLSATTSVSIDAVNRLQRA